MNNDWKEFLLSNGAQQDSQGLFYFNDEASENRKAPVTDAICDLSHFSTLVIAGEDARSFMQGQFTNDVEQVNASTSQLSAFCNNKGRMIANFRLFEHNNNVFMTLRSDLVDPSIEHLQKYILRAQVVIQDVSDQLVHLGVSGSNAKELLSSYIENIDEAVDSISHNEDYVAIRVAGPVPRYEVFCSCEQAKFLWQGITQRAAAINSSAWNYLNIQAGIPYIDMNTSEEFVPQMANMELINGVSFTKGCFTGQEIVARTHYLGKQKRRTYRIKIISDTTPKAGDELATDTSTENQYTGTLVTVYQTAEKEFEALAVIQIKSVESETLKLKDADAEIMVLELPYPLEDQG